MSPADLQSALQAVQRAAVLVSPAVLDKIIRQTLKLPGWMWSVPHRRTWNVERQFLFRHVEQEDLLVPPDHLLPVTIILLAKPAADTMPDRELLRSYWRLLFHASLDLELANQAAAGLWNATAVQERLERLGTTTFEEIRHVLTQEHHLAPGADDRQVYLEFVAVFLELYYFARPLLDSYFPGVRDAEAVKHEIDRDLASQAVFEKTRLGGARHPDWRATSCPHEAQDYFDDLIRASDRAARSGDLVLAAIKRRQAARVAPAPQAGDTLGQAIVILETMLLRLQPAVEITSQDLPLWSKYLPELLDKADQGTRPQEALLLYDLQKVCVDFEREIYTLDVVEWALSGGKKPVQRPLSSQRLVRVTRHLRSAVQRLPVARLSEGDRKDFAKLLHDALGRCETRVRERFRPILTTTLEDVGLAPRNIHEKTAFLKLTEELLDRILEFGFLTFSDLRDALARNLLKLPDLADPQDFIRGDPLLRLDRRLATLLDGVYRRGEIYLRLLERFTALNFGTALGRLMTQFVTIPFLGAFLLVFALKHFALSPLGMSSLPTFVFVLMWAAVGAFFLGLMHSPAVRRRCLDFSLACWRPLKGLCVDMPLWVVQNSTLPKLLSSWSFQLFYWYVAKPLVLCTILWILYPETFSNWLQVALTFLAANFIVNSGPGQAAAEAISHLLIRFVALLRSGLIPGLIRLVVQIFKQSMHAMEAVLFKVDEWLHLRGSDSRLGMAVRVLGGVLWYPIGYLARLNMVVLIEPGINPVKLPVSILATKIMFLQIFAMNKWLAEADLDLVTKAIGFWVVFWLPDVFGFLFWEIKENWRLFEANRGPIPAPAVIGSHGETMERLLQPGFHSGTIPKLFARLRHAEQRAQVDANFSSVRAAKASLEEVEEAVRLFVVREFLVLLEQDSAWKNRELAVGKVHLATNQIGVELRHSGHAEPLWMDFEDQHKTLIAGLTTAPWLRDLSSAQQHALQQSLATVFERAGADECRPMAWASNWNGRYDPAKMIQDLGVGERRGVSPS